MPDGAIVFSTKLDNKGLEKDLAKQKDLIEKSEAEVEDLAKKRDAAKKRSVFSAAELDAEKAKLAQMKKDLQEMRAIAKDKTISPGVAAEAKASIPGALDDISDQQARVRMLQSEYNKVDDSVLRYDKKLQDAEEKLRRHQEKAGELAQTLAGASKASLAVAKAHDKAQKNAARFARRLKEVVRSALVFTLITQSLAKFREWMGKVIKTNSEATAAVARLKGALLTLAQPLVEVIIPAFTLLVNALAKVVAFLAQAMSALFRKTAAQSADAAKALNDEMDALEGVGDAADESSKSIAAFDEINKLSGNGAGTGGASEVIEPDLNWDMDLPQEQFKNILGLVTAIGTALLTWKISSLLGGGLKNTTGALVLVAGAIEYVRGIFDAWTNGVSWDNLGQSILGLTGIVGGLYLLLGPTAAAIGAIVGGLAMLVTGFKDAFTNGWNLQNLFMSIAGLLVTGIGISALTGSFIPALIAGIAAILLAVTVATGHGEELLAGVKQTLSGFLEFFKGIFTGDMEMAMSGINNIFDGLKNAVGAVVSGVKDLFLSFFDWLNEKTGGKLSGIIEAMKALFSGLFDSVSQMLGGLLDAIKDIFGGVINFITGVFTGDWDRAWQGIKDIFKGIWNGIISLIEGAINLLINGLNFLLSGLAKVAQKAGELLGFSGWGENWAIPQVSLPRLATGAVIPPNREFLAVLGDQKSGTNIEAPLSTIEQAVENVLNRRGTGNSGEMTLVLDGDLAALARVLRPYMLKEDKRVGVNLVTK